MEPAIKTDETSNRKALLVKSYEDCHRKEVLDVVVSNDNSFFASCGVDRTTYVWDVKTGKTTHKLYGHQRAINSLDLNKSSGSTVLATGSVDCTVNLYDLRQRSSGTQSLLMKLGDFADSVSSVRIATSEIICSTLDGYIFVYDLRSPKVHKHSFSFTPSLPTPPTAISFNNFQCSRDEKCLLIDITIGLKQRTSSNSSGSHSSKFLQGLLLMEKQSGTVLQTYIAKSDTKEAGSHKKNLLDYNSHCCFDSSEQYVLSANRAGSSTPAVNIWETISGTVHSPQSSELHTASILPSTNANNDTARLLKTGEGSKVGRLVSSIACHPTENSVLLSRYDGICYASTLLPRTE